MSGTPYLASEDSALLREAIGSYSGGRCLEIGAGNGGNLVCLSRGFASAVGSDIVRPAMGDWSHAGADFVLADLAACFRDEVFDLVVFNPPYLPSEKIRDRAVDAGREAEVPLEFLREALRVVKGAGAVVMLLSSENPIERFSQECARKGFAISKIAERRVFFEELSVYEARSQGQAVATGGPTPGGCSVQTETSAVRRLHQVPASPA